MVGPPLDKFISTRPEESPNADHHGAQVLPKPSHGVSDVRDREEVGDRSAPHL